MIGFRNIKMSNILTAIGCAQLERIDELISKKKKNILFYKEFEKVAFFIAEPEKY